MASPASRLSYNGLGNGTHYNGISVPALREEWKSRGLKGYSHLKKIDLIKGLLEDDGVKPNTPYDEMCLSDLRTQCQHRGYSFESTTTKEELVMLLEDDDRDEQEVANYGAISKTEALNLVKERGIPGVNTKTRKNSLVRLLILWDKLQEMSDSEQVTEASQTPVQEELPLRSNPGSADKQNEPTSSFEVEMMELMTRPLDVTENDETQELGDDPSWTTFDSPYFPESFPITSVGDEYLGMLYELELYLAKADNTQSADSKQDTTYSSKFHSSVHNIIGEDPLGKLLNPAIIWDLPHLHFAMMTLLFDEDERFKLVWQRLYCGASWRSLIETTVDSSSYDEDYLRGEALHMNPRVAAMMPQESMNKQLATKIDKFRETEWGQLVWTQLEEEVDARLLVAGQNLTMFPTLQLKVAEHYLIAAKRAYSKVPKAAGVWWTVQLVQDIHRDGSVIKTCEINIPEKYGWDRVSLAFQASSNSAFSHHVGFPHGFALKHGHWNYQVDMGYSGASLENIHRISARGFVELRRLMLAGNSRSELLIWHDVQIEVARKRRDFMRKLFESANRATPEELGIIPGYVPDDPGYGLETENPWSAFGITPGEPWPEDVRKAMYEYDQSGADLSELLDPAITGETLTNGNGDAATALPDARDLAAPAAYIPLASVDHGNSSAVPNSNGFAASTGYVHDDPADVDAVFRQLIDLDSWPTLRN